MAQHRKSCSTHRAIQNLGTFCLLYRTEVQNGTDKQTCKHKAMCSCAWSQLEYRSHAAIQVILSESLTDHAALTFYYH